MKFNSHTHIKGKVYDLTQENMNALIEAFEFQEAESERLFKELVDAIADHPCYQLSKDLEAENARLRGALETLLDRPHEQHCDWLDPGPDQCNCWLREARAALEG